MSHAAFSMASFAFCVAFVTIASAMSSIAVATEAGDWYLMTLYLGSSDNIFKSMQVLWYNMIHHAKTLTH